MDLLATRNASAAQVELTSPSVAAEREQTSVCLLYFSAMACETSAFQSAVFNGVLVPCILAW